MRKKIVAGNWKMNENLQEGVALAKEINEALVADKPNCGVIICTPFIHLASVAQVIDQNVVALGAENCADKEKGAFTGEVSAAMVKSTGAQYVILGHSERRQYYGETAEILKEKVQLALANFSGQYAVDWGSLLAMSVLTMIPVLVIFLLFQKQFMKGMIAGAVKG